MLNWTARLAVWLLDPLVLHIAVFSKKYALYGLRNEKRCVKGEKINTSLFLGFIRARIWYKQRGVVQHNFSCASVWWDYINIHSLTVDLFQPAPCFHVGAWETFDIIRLSSTVFQCSVWNIETAFLSDVTSVPYLVQALRDHAHLEFCANLQWRVFQMRWRRICTIWTRTLFLSLSFLNNRENITSVTLSRIFIKPQA